jgi:hypothetical protein
VGATFSFPLVPFERSPVNDDVFAAATSSNTIYIVEARLKNLKDEGKVHKGAEHKQAISCLHWDEQGKHIVFGDKAGLLLRFPVKLPTSALADLPGLSGLSAISLSSKKQAPPADALLNTGSPIVQLQVLCIARVLRACVNARCVVSNRVAVPCLAAL